MDPIRGAEMAVLQDKSPTSMALHLVLQEWGRIPIVQRIQEMAKKDQNRTLKAQKQRNLVI